MVNYIYQLWDNESIYRIDCGNLKYNYIIDLLKIVSGASIYWIDKFVKHHEKYNKNAKLFAYVPINRFYINGLIDSPNYYLFNNNIDYKLLAIYYKENCIANSLIDDFYNNHKKYRQEAIIKSIIE